MTLNQAYANILSMEQYKNTYPTPPEPLGESRPIHYQKVINGEDRIDPADVVGRLEKELYAVSQAAATHDPQTPAGQRFAIAISSRQNALQTLNNHDGDVKASLKSLKSEKKQARKEGDPDLFSGIDREMRIIKSVKRDFYSHHAEPSYLIHKIERSRSYNPEYGERGLLGAIGHSLLTLVPTEINMGRPSLLKDANSFYEAAMSETLFFRKEAGAGRDAHLSKRRAETAKFMGQRLLDLQGISRGLQAEDTGIKLQGKKKRKPKLSQKKSRTASI